MGPIKENGEDDAGANGCVPNAGLGGADPNAPPLAGELNEKEVLVDDC